VYLAVRLMNLISAVFNLFTSLCFSVRISQPYKSNWIFKYYVISIEIVFGLNLVS
jgi:hypothetical protein